MTLWADSLSWEALRQYISGYRRVMNAIWENQKANEDSKFCLRKAARETILCLALNIWHASFTEIFLAHWQSPLCSFRLPWLRPRTKGLFWLHSCAKRLSWTLWPTLALRANTLSPLLPSTVVDLIHSRKANWDQKLGEKDPPTHSG